jgi:hypothetical protein
MYMYKYFVCHHVHMCICVGEGDYIYIIEVHNIGNIFDLIDSSFEHVLHPYNLSLVIYLIMYFIYWKNQVSSFQVSQNSMAYLNQCLLLNTKKVQQCHIQKLNPSFLFNLHQI